MALNLDHQKDRITTNSGTLNINTNGSIRIPVGNTAQRPGASATGQIRFNTQLNRFEGYNGNSWTQLGGVIDADQDTYIEVDNPLDNDTIKFFTGGTERVSIDNTGKFTVEGDTVLKGNVSIGGDITIGDADTDGININSDFNNSLLPNLDITYNLGSSIKKWKNIFMGGTLDAGSSTEAFILPQGTDAQRPGTVQGNDPAQTGMLRFSTTSSKAEVYDGTSWVLVGATPNTFSTIKVNGSADVVADSDSDELTLVAGTGIAIATNATTDEITISTVGGGGGSAQNLFDKIAVSGQNNIIADNVADTLTFQAGNGITITTDPNNDLVRFDVSVSGYDDAAVDTHLNTSTAVAGEVLSWDGTDYDWVSNAGYTDADVDTHIRVATASAGQALIYDGTDYQWSTVGGQITIQEEGSNLSTAATTLNFVGDGVTASGTGAVKTITIVGSDTDAIVDADADTHIKVEAVADEDKIRFTTAGTERARIDVDGKFIIGDVSTNTFYKLPSTRGTDGQVPVTDAFGNVTFQTIASGSGTAYYQTSAPTIGINAGDLWFDTGTTAELYVYTGGEWVSVVSGADTGFIPVNFTANGSTQAFDANVGDGTVSMVFLNGVLMQDTNDYTETGGVVTFVGTPNNGSQIDIIVTGEINAITLPVLGLTNHTLISTDGSGNLQATSLQGNNLTNNRVLIAGASGVIEDDANFTFDGTTLNIGTTGSIQLPNGTTAQRPTPSTGMLRFNSSTTKAEVYNGSIWDSLAGEIPQDSDGDTKIVFESSSGSDEDEIDFYTAGTQRMQIGSNGNFAFGAGLNKFTIDYTTGATQINSANVHKGNSGVTAGAYGSSTLIPVVTIDAEGHVTAVSTVAPTISYTPNPASNWNGTAPTTIEEAVDRLATLVKALNSGTGA